MLIRNIHQVTISEVWDKNLQQDAWSQSEWKMRQKAGKLDQIYLKSVFKHTGQENSDQNLTRRDKLAQDRGK